MDMIQKFAGHTNIEQTKQYIESERMGPMDKTEGVLAALLFYTKPTTLRQVATDRGG